MTNIGKQDQVRTERENCCGQRTCPPSSPCPLAWFPHRAAQLTGQRAAADLCFQEGTSTRVGSVGRVQGRVQGVLQQQPQQLSLRHKTSASFPSPCRRYQDRLSAAAGSAQAGLRLLPDGARLRLPEARSHRCRLWSRSQSSLPTGEDGVGVGASGRVHFLPRLPLFTRHCRHPRGPHRSVGRLKTFPI